MENKIKVLGVLLLAGFSFFYTNKVTNIIRENDPIMNRIIETKSNMAVSKIEPIIMEEEYITGINGCIIDEKESYNKMKNVGEFKEELLVMKEDSVNTINNKYIKGGNEEKRNVSIILLVNNNKINEYIKKNNIKINYFFDGNYITNNIDILIENSKYSKIYNYGRNKNYLSKYIAYDNSIISLNFNNESSYCLFKEKNSKELKLCSSYKMKSIKEEFIYDDIFQNIKTNLKNGKIFIINSSNYQEIIISMKYIQSKGYNIVFLDELLSQKNKCN